MSSSFPRLLIVDDDPDLLELLKAWFACCGQPVTTIRDGLEAVELLKESPFDVVVTDLKMPGLSGLHLLAIVKQLAPQTEVIILTGQATIDDAIEALRGGRAFDFLQKPLKNLQQLSDAVERACARRRGANSPSDVRFEHLTPREEEVLQLLRQGLENREIAERLVVSEKTVKNHLTRIYEKLQVKNRMQAVLLAQR